jgi:hypothetical protein
MTILKKIPEDRTFNQNLHFDVEPNSKYWSIDLTNATDRFPIAFQHYVLELMYGTDYANAWRSVMVGFKFTNPLGPPVFYGAGQPMGAYSS